jgi:hypothetical protein
MAKETPKEIPKEILRVLARAMLRVLATRRAQPFELALAQPVLVQGSAAAAN